VIRVEYHADLKEVQSDAALARLLSDSTSRAPFDRIQWWEALAVHCGIEPVLAVARDGDSVAVLPLRREGNGFAALGNWYSFRVRPLFSASAEPATMLGAIAADLAGRTDRLELRGLGDEDGSATQLAEAFREAGWFAVREPCDVNHFLEVDGRSYEQYLATRPGKLRTTLKRKSGKVETRVLTQFDENIWAAYEAIYAESWKPEEGSPAFLRAFAEAEGTAGRLRLAVAHAGGEAIAAQMWTVEGGTAFIHKLAHRESAKPLSPGTVLSAALFRHVIDEDKVTTIDFGTGNDGYKRDWMESVRSRYRLALYRPLAPRNWPEIMRIGLKRLAATAKRG
jgi:CelD/BcsL family acetyltransferase involved in cellulose biosynthesis